MGCDAKWDGIGGDGMGCQVRREGAAAEDNTQPGNAKDNKQSASHDDLKQPKPIPNDAKIGNKTEKNTHTRSTNKKSTALHAQHNSN